MKVWQVTWDSYDESADSSYPSWELFATEKAARASCPENGNVSEVTVRDEALRSEVRYRVWSRVHWNEDRLPEVLPTETYTVNEQQADFGKPLTRESGWWLDGPTFNSSNREQAERAVHKEIDPAIARERDRLDYLARCTHQFRCPDHGDLSKSTPESHVPCIKCHRWVDKRGIRFGRYESWFVDGMIHFDMSAGTAPESDEGPLPVEDLRH